MMKPLDQIMHEAMLDAKAKALELAEKIRNRFLKHIFAKVFDWL